VLVPQTLEDRHHFYPLFQELLHDLGVGLNARDDPEPTGHVPQASPNRLVVGH
jgi:hypothetical protein